MDEVQERTHGLWPWREQPAAAGLSLPFRDFGCSALSQRGKANTSNVKLGIELRLEPSRVSSCTFLALARTEGPSSQGGLMAIPFLKGSHWSCAGNRGHLTRCHSPLCAFPQEAGPTMVGDEHSDPHLMSILGATRRTTLGNNL